MKEQEHLLGNPSRRAGFVPILSLELLDQFQSVDVVCRFPGMIFRAIALPVHEVLQASLVVAQVEDLAYFKLFSAVHEDGQVWRP